MRQGINLQKKAVLIVAGILFFILGINTAVLTFVAYDKYKSAILSKTGAIAEGMQRELSKVLSLGVPVESLEGVNEKMKELISRDSAIAYAMVVDTKGKVLFHNNEGKVGQELKDKVSAKILSSDKKLIQTFDAFYDLSFPLLNAESKMVGALRVGVQSKAINAQLYELLLWALGISALCFFLSIGLVYFSISKFITLPIMSMEEAAERIASGDLTSAIDVRGRDEIASLGQAINKMAYNLKDMVSKITGVTGSVSRVTQNIIASSESILTVADVQKKAVEETSVAIAEMDNSTSSVAQGADTLSGLAVDTSSSIMEMTRSVEKVAESSNVLDESTQETASSVEEMIANIRQITQSLENLSSSSEEVVSAIAEVDATVKEIEHRATESVGLAEKVMTDASDKGMGAARAASEGMEDIKTRVKALSDIINVLGKRSEDIGMILNVIDEVAEQTNLLSLNAAILAAQAGEHGKAFTVVAEEIKSLAEKTSVSTREIAGLITSVQADTKSSVEMAADGIVTVEKGLKLVRDVNDALNGIVHSAKVATEMSRAIQRATSEESQVIKQITDAIKGMSNQVENIALASQEQSKGSRFIIEATEKMKDMSRHIKTATGEQRDGSKQISGAIENVTGHAEKIAKATGGQKQRSAEIVQSMGKIQETTVRLVGSSNAMNAAISSLKEEAQNLLSELQKFKV